MSRVPNNRKPVIRPAKPSYAGVRGMSRKDIFDHIQAFQQVAPQITNQSQAVTNTDTTTTNTNNSQSNNSGGSGSINPSNLTPSSVNPGVASDPGISPLYTRSDHIHALGSHASTHGESGSDPVTLDASQITTGLLATAQGGVLTGGTTGQVLTKNSNSNNDLVWSNSSSGGTVCQLYLPVSSSIPVSNSYTTIQPTGGAPLQYTLAAGVWDISAKVDFNSGTTSNDLYAIQIVYAAGGATVLNTVSELQYPITNGANEPFSIDTMATISLSTTTTLQVQAVNLTAARGTITGGQIIARSFSVGQIGQTPVITSFTPNYGLSGTVVTITGSGFTGAGQVQINSTNVSSYTVNTDTQITATVAFGTTSGPFTVSVTAGVNTTTATSTNQFYYYQSQPNITVSSASGSIQTGSGSTGTSISLSALGHLTNDRTYIQITSNASSSSNVTGVTSPGFTWAKVTDGTTTAQVGGSAGSDYIELWAATALAGSNGTDIITITHTLNSPINAVAFSLSNTTTANANKVVTSTVSGTTTISMPSITTTANPTQFLVIVAGVTLATGVTPTGYTAINLGVSYAPTIVLETGANNSNGTFTPPAPASFATAGTCYVIEVALNGL